MISVLNSAAISLRVSGIWSGCGGLVCSVAGAVAAAECQFPGAAAAADQQPAVTGAAGIDGQPGTGSWR